MATRKINYKDKSPLQTKPEIPGENKVNAEDLNQIKEVVNNNADEIELRQLKEEGKGLSKNDFTDELKAKLESLNNYNDTEIKKEINEINKKVAENTENDIKQDNEILELKTNYTNLQEQNTKLESQIKKDRENMINLEVEGQSIHIEDSSDLEGKLEVLGNVEQDVREGYNLYDYMSKAISTTKGLTVTKDTENGYLIVNGTPEVSYLSVCNSMEITDILKDKATYTLWQEKYDNKLYLQVVGTKKDGTGNTYFFSASQKTAFTVDKSKYSRYAINIQIGLTTQAGTFNNYKNRYMLYEGTEEKPYEPYGASPSPEYPSTVRAVGDNINLLENTAKTQIINGVEFTVNPDKTIKINGTATENISTDITKNFAITEQSIFSGMCDGYGYNKMLIQIQGSDYNVNIPNSTPQVLQPKDNVKVRIYIYAGTSITNAIIKPQINKGTVAKPYEQYGASPSPEYPSEIRAVGDKGSVEIKKQTQNILSLTELPATIDGITVNKNSGKIVLNGTTTKQNDKYKIGTFNTRENRNYILSITNKVNGLGFNANFNTIGLTADFNITKTGPKLTGKSMTTNAGKVELYMAFNKDITFNNLEIGIMVEEDKETGEFVEHQEQTKILPIQKPMLIRDYFDKLNNKEVHTWKKIVLDGVNNKVTQTTTNLSGKYRYIYTDKDLQDCSLSEEKAYCTHLPLIGKSKTYDKILGFTVANNSIYIYTDGDIASNFNAKLQKENYVFYIPVIESAYQNLDLTPEQTKVLDELNNFQTYKPVTNITTDSIAKLKLKYIADTKTYVDNKTSNLEQQVNTINQLLSTTKTSAKLLDNLQSDIESEVL